MIEYLEKPNVEDLVKSGNKSAVNVKPLIPSITPKAKNSGANLKEPNTTALVSDLQKPPLRNPMLTSDGDFFESPLYNFRDFIQAEDVEGMVRLTFRLTVEGCLKQGFYLTGPNTELVKLIHRRLKWICKRSRTNLYSLIETIVSSLTKYNNAFVLFSRKDPVKGTKFNPYDYEGKTLNPISGFWPAEPFWMNPVYKKGRLKKWDVRKNDNSFLSSNSYTKNFEYNDVMHAYWDKRISEDFATPWILPGLDDVRLYRRVEEYAQMSITKNLFPIYQYKIGTKERPAVTFSDGTKEVAIIQASVGDLPTQGVVFTPERHEIVAIDASSPIQLDKYLEHFKGRAKSSLGLSDLDLGTGGTANRGTATVLNQTREDRCVRIQKTCETFVNESIIFSMLLELGLDPFDEDNEVRLAFNEINQEEKRARESHSTQLWTNQGLTHDEYRQDIKRKPFASEEEWENTHMNIVGLASAEMGSEAKVAQDKEKANIANITKPANQSGSKIKTKNTANAK
jgi:hypothetical protein